MSFVLRCLLGLVYLFLPNLTYSQNIGVSLPDTAARAGTSITIPIRVGSLTNRNVLFYQAIIVFDKNILRATGASSAGTLSEPFGTPALDISVEGEILIFASGMTPLVGSGSLVDLFFDVLGQPGETTQLTFAGFVFNAGLPSANTTHGKFTVLTPIEPDINIKPTKLDFGKVGLGSASVKAITLSNEGAGTLSIDSIDLSGPNASQFVIRSRKPPFNIAAADSEVLQISFQPQSEGTQNAGLQVRSNDPDEGTIDLELTGTGVSALELTPIIESPQDSAVVCGDSVLVKVVLVVANAVKPFTLKCELNGVAGTRVGKNFLMKVPLAIGENSLVAACSIVDAVGATDTSATSINVFRNPPPSVNLEIISPKADTFVCDDKIEMTFLTRINKGTPPLVKLCEVNGVSFMLPDSVFSLTLPLVAGENQIIASCTVTDSCGFEVTSRDTVAIFSDTTPPECELNFENYPTITGRVFDPESGISSFEIIEVLNRTITMDSFEVGEKIVNFVLDKIDPNARANFVFKAFNQAGCEVICDPIDLTLSPSNSPCNFNFFIPERERYLHIRNRGLHKIVLQINQNEFNLVAASNSENKQASYFIPLNGERSFDISSTLFAGENEITLICEGPQGTYADILITDNLPGGEVTILDSRKGKPILPEEFELAQNYPNPFNPATKIEFSLPKRFSQGLRTQLRIYNLLGEQVLTLVDEHKMPGHYILKWDGRDRKGNQLPSGIYIYQLRAGNLNKTRRMMLLR